MSNQWFPKEEDLRNRAARGLEEAYRTRERAKCSRNDFADGFMAGLRFLSARSEFKDGRFEPEDPAAES